MSSPPYPMTATRTAVVSNSWWNRYNTVTTGMTDSTIQCSTTVTSCSTDLETSVLSQLIELWWVVASSFGLCTSQHDVQYSISLSLNAEWELWAGFRRMSFETVKSQLTLSQMRPALNLVDFAGHTSSTMRIIRRPSGKKKTSTPLHLDHVPRHCIVNKLLQSTRIPSWFLCVPLSLFSLLFSPLLLFMWKDTVSRNDFPYFCCVLQSLSDDTRTPLNRWPSKRHVHYFSCQRKSSRIDENTQITSSWECAEHISSQTHEAGRLIPTSSISKRQTQ